MTPLFELFSGGDDGDDLDDGDDGGHHPVQGLQQGDDVVVVVVVVLPLSLNCSPSAETATR